MSLQSESRNRPLKLVTPRALLLAGIGVFLLFNVMQASAASFQNLNFEKAGFAAGPPYGRVVSSTEAMPGWTVVWGGTPAPGCPMHYDGVNLDLGDVAILDTNALYGALEQTFEGRFTVVLQGGFANYPYDRVSAGIAQTGAIPVSAKSLLFDAELWLPGRTNFVLSIAGEPLPFGPVEYHTNFVVYSADVSRFAGQNVELRFTSYPRPYPELAAYRVYLDEIRFSAGMGGSDFLYVKQNGAITITGYTGQGGPVTIPSAIDGLPVIGIGAGAFSQCYVLGDLVIPNSVTNIGASAFQNCVNLMSVNIPSGVTAIAASTFAGCEMLFSVTIPSAITSIADSAFSGSGLVNVTIPAGVVSIGNSVFQSCFGLTGVYFTGNVPSLGGPEVFYLATNATVYHLPGASGWGPTFGGRPTVLWNALIQTADSGFGVHANRFGFNITGTHDIPIVIEGSPSLGNPAWSQMLICNLTNGSVAFSDPNWTQSTARFYRLRWP